MWGFLLNNFFLYFYTKLNLQKLILILIFICTSILFITSILILNYIVKEQLIQSSLLNNQKYATKIALTTDKYFESMLDELQFSAHLLGKDFDDNQLRNSEVTRLKLQSKKFNSISIVDKNSYILNINPKNMTSNSHQHYTSLGLSESLRLKKTYISPPYLGLSKNLLVLVSQPIFDKNQNFLGCITGSVYLKKNNLINELISTSYPYKKSYIFVIDNRNRIIFHPDQGRIGETIKNNTGLEFINQNSSGNIQLINSKDLANLAGFAHVPSVDWTVISQQPTEELLSQANKIIYKACIGILFFYLIMFMIIWKLSHRISSPLNNLAQMASMLTKPEIQDEIKKVNPWYFEVFRFRTALLFSSKKFNEEISKLKQDVNTDPLTGLYNRRGMDLLLQELIATNTHFGLIAMDIDHFKKINDTYGHDQGDKALQNITAVISSQFRKHDICCRVGGEEFMIFVATDDVKTVYAAAEELRQSIELFYQDSMKITVSIGVSFFTHDSTDIETVIKLADMKLYQAKAQGRNQVC